MNRLLQIVLFIICIIPNYAQAMTAQEFLRDHEHNLELATMVLWEAEAGGIENLVSKCQELVVQNSAELQRGGFFFMAYASSFMPNLTADEQAYYTDRLRYCIQQSANYHKFDYDQLILALDGASLLFEEAMDIITEEFEEDTNREGKSLNLYDENCLTQEEADTYAMLLMNEVSMSKYPLGQVPLDIVVEMDSKVFAKLGYSYNQIIYDNLKGATKEDITYLFQIQTIAVILPALNALENETIINSVLNGGHLTRETVDEILRVRSFFDKR